MAIGPSTPDEPLDLSGPIVVPDDASALEADRLALLAELTQRAHLEATSETEPKPQMWPYLLVFSATLLAFAGFIAVFLPQAARPPSATALGLPRGGTATGQVGGLLPLGTVRIGLFDRALRDFRPGVVAVVPSGDCPGCEATISSLWEQETAFQLPLLIVGSGASLDRLQTYSAAAGGSAWAVDRQTLLPHPATGQLTLYAVHSDGIIEAIVQANPGTQLEPVLRNLDLPGAVTPTAK
jgi:hypothetical protein